MIVKEKDPRVARDKFEQAGDAAEKQMAFYLRRAFADDPSIFVFNDLRLERSGEIAQVDHLILHPFGFVLVESKSVVGKLTVNKQGEFTRTFDRACRGIASPIRQVQIQAELLRSLLNDYKETLRRKVFFGMKQAEFGDARFNVYVAVSETGAIERQQCDPPELRKADQVTDEIKGIVQRHQVAGGLGGFLRLVTSDRETSKRIEEDHLIPLTDQEMAAIRDFLLSRHVAKSRPPEPPPVVPPLPPTAAAIDTPKPPPVSDSSKCCKFCQSKAVQIRHGKFGYYFKCDNCGKNTPINFTCPGCGKKARVSKSGREFMRDCPACGEKSLFHVNSAP